MATGPRRIRVDDEGAGRRIEVWLCKALPGMTPPRVRALLEAGRVRIGGRACRAGRKLWGGEEIDVDLPPPRAPSVPIRPAGPHASEPSPPLPVLYEDESLVVVDKPPSLTVEPEGRAPSVVALLAGGGRFDVGGVAAPGVAHRLDRHTSGCLALAKDDETLAALERAFGEKQVEKTYLALVLGAPPDEARLAGPYARDPRDPRRFTTRVPSARRASLRFRVRERFTRGEGPAALLEVRLETGRTHQIRVQLSEAGFPVLADAVYGSDMARTHPAAQRIGRQALHAWKLALPHPRTGRPLAFEARVPADFEAALALLRGG